MQPNLSVAMLMALSLAPIGAAAEGTDAGNAALRDLQGYAIEAVVGGSEVRALVTEADVEAEMSRTLTQLGIANNRAEFADTGGGRLQLVFQSYSVEPVLPHEHDEPVQVFPISVYLSVSRPLLLETGGTTTEINAQVWWTHVEAWALQRSMHAVACMAIRRALGRFVDAHTAAQTGGMPPDLSVTAQN